MGATLVMFERDPAVEQKVDEELEEQKKRHRPEAIEELCRQTNFNKKEIQLLYRGFKENCPNGIVTAAKFRDIFSQFFSFGDSTGYSQLVFNTFDQDGNGKISFEEFVNALSVLLRGTTDQKLEWVFELYDFNHRGYVTKADLHRVTQGMYDLMGKNARPAINATDVENHVDYVYKKLDLNKDGVITLNEFLQGCKQDANVLASLHLFQTVWQS